MHNSPTHTHFLRGMWWLVVYAALHLGRNNSSQSLLENLKSHMIHFSCSIMGFSFIINFIMIVEDVKAYSILFFSEISPSLIHTLQFTVACTSLLSLPFLHYALPGNGSHNTADSSASVFHDSCSCWLTPISQLFMAASLGHWLPAVSGLHWPLLASTCFPLVCRMLTTSYSNCCHNPVTDVLLITILAFSGHTTMYLLNLRGSFNK
jgi:hypothetical protein